MMRGCGDRGEISPIRISVTQIWTSLSKFLHMNFRERRKGEVRGRPITRSSLALSRSSIGVWCIRLHISGET